MGRLLKSLDKKVWRKSHWKRRRRTRRKKKQEVADFREREKFSFSKTQITTCMNYLLEASLSLGPSTYHVIDHGGRGVYKKVTLNDNGREGGLPESDVISQYFRFEIIVFILVAITIKIMNWGGGCLSAFKI